MPKCDYCDNEIVEEDSVKENYYGDGSPYECGSCPAPLHPGCGFYCELCEQNYCEKHGTQCHSCGDMLCEKHYDAHCKLYDHD